jgi:hypothetical protein
VLGFLGRKPSDGDACGRHYPVEGVASPALSSTGGNPVHSLDVRRRRIRRRNLPEGIMVEFGSVSPVADAVCFWAPGLPLLQRLGLLRMRGIRRRRGGRLWVEIGAAPHLSLAMITAPASYFGLTVLLYVGCL